MELDSPGLYYVIANLCGQLDWEEGTEELGHWLHQLGLSVGRGLDD